MSYYVITRTYLEDPESRGAVLEMSKASAEIFKKQPGLIDMKSLYAENETHISTYLVWEDQKSHLSCMESKDFNKVTSRWTEFIQQGKIRFELETYSTLS